MLAKIKKMFIGLNTTYHNTGGILGFLSFVVCAMQIYTGIILTTDYLPEPAIVNKAKEEGHGSYVRFVSKELYMHEIGVQVLIVATLYHILVKI